MVNFPYLQFIVGVTAVAVAAVFLSSVRQILVQVLHFLLRACNFILAIRRLDTIYLASDAPLK